MAISNAIHLLASSCSIATVGVRNERKSLCFPSVSVLGQKHASDPAKPLKHIPKFFLFGKLGYIGDTKRSEIIALAILAEAGASHAFPSTGASLTTQMRGNVSTAGLLSRSARFRGSIRVARCRSRSSGIVERWEGNLVWAFRGEVITLADTAGYLLVLCWSLILFSGDSSSISVAFQLVEGRKTMFSRIVVVERSGPGGGPPRCQTWPILCARRRGG